LASVVNEYLSLPDAERESAFAALASLSDSQIWQRPALKEWGIGENLNHNYLSSGSFPPAVKWMWNLVGCYSRLT
jgi:hypothetical protein